VRRELLEYMACPVCAGDFVVDFEEVVGEEGMTGTLTCTGCERSFPVLRGVPRMNRAMDKMERVAETFGYEWKAHHEGRLEDETLFGRTLEQDWRYFQEATGLYDGDVNGKVVLDAGCGSGRPTRQIGEHGAAAVIGVDFNEAVDDAFSASRDLSNVHIVQANIFELPLKKRAFDLVWSNGVIHHTPNARGAHAALSEFVTPGGILYIWVYAKRFNPFRFVKDVLDAARVTRLPEPALLRVSHVFAYVSIPLLWLYQRMRKLPALQPRTRWGEQTVRPRTVRELQLTWFDALSPDYDSRHTEEEVIGWFERCGFIDVRAIEEPKVGVRGVAPAA
jgi:SAM-dependent methyltransferase